MVSWRHYNWNRGESRGGVIDQVEVVALYQSLSSRYQSSSMRVSRRHYQSSSRYVAVICSELQCVAECMQWVAEVCNLLVGAYGSGVSPRHYQSGTRCVAMCCSELQWVAVSCRLYDLLVGAYGSRHSHSPPNRDTQIFRYPAVTNSNWVFGFIWIRTEDFEFVDLVDVGGVTLSVEAVN